MPFQATSDREGRLKAGLITPHLCCVPATDSVCLVLFSLAVTRSISIDFFSFRYWDASLPWVPVPFGTSQEIRISFRNLRFEGCVRLAGAFRSLPRPSSALEPSHPSNGAIISTSPMHGHQDNYDIHPALCKTKTTLGPKEGILGATSCHDHEWWIQSFLIKLFFKSLFDRASRYY